MTNELFNEKAEKLLKDINQFGPEHITEYKHKNKTISMSLGRQFFNCLLPDDFDLYNESIDSNKIEVITKKLLEKYGSEKTSEVLSNIQYYCFKLSAILPSSFNIDGLIPPKEWLQKKEEFQKNPPKDLQKYKEEVKKLTIELTEHLKSQNSQIQNYLETGSRDPYGDWSAMMVSKGYVLDVEDKLLGPIVHSINDGYTPLEFYQGAAEARRGFYYRSTAVADPGYLSRKLAMANAKTVIDDSVNDCKTKKYLTFNITNKNHKLIQGRYIYPNTKIEETEKYINQSIKLRSPLFCKSENGICPTCYGDLYKILKSKKIGILASGAMNIVGVNAFMKMRHQSSQVDIVEINFIKLLQNSKIDKLLLNKVLKIEKNKIIAKEIITINIDREDYDEKSLIDNGDLYKLPGLIDITYGEFPNMEIINLPFSFKINLIKPENYNIDGKVIILNYNPGEIIIEQDNYIKEVDPSTISKLFEAQAKYITDPEVLLNALHQQLPSIDIVHLETVIQNMFRSKENPEIIGRLIDYQNVEIYSQKRLPFVNSWLNSMAFENINKAISTGLLSNKSIQFDPYENLILEKFEQDEG